MANLKFQKIILKIIKEGVSPLANPRYPSKTWLMQKAVKYLDASLKEMSEEEFASRYKYSISRTYEKLCSDKNILIDKNNSPRLTEKGKSLLEKLEVNEYAIPKPRRWDRKYRIISFDISEGKKKIRNTVRHQLISWGFVRLQNSVWVHPYECEEVIAMLKTYFGVVREVLYITAESIENDAWLKKEFGLLS